MVMLRLASALSVFALASCTSLGVPGLPSDPASLFRIVPTMMVVNVSDAPLEINSMTATQGLFCRVYFFHGDDAIPLQVVGETIFQVFDKGKNGEKPIQ